MAALPPAQRAAEPPMTTTITCFMKWLLRRRHPYLIAALGSLLMAGFAWPAAPPTSPVLIPLPARFTRLEGSFVLGPKTVIRVTKPEVNTAEMLAAAIARSTGLKARVRAESKPAKQVTVLNGLR